MKYYIGKYWAMANSTDHQEQALGKMKWTETAKEYGSYYESIKNMLPQVFLKEFESKNWFHDFCFESISIIDFNKYVSTVVFGISLDDDSYVITFLGVEKIIFNIPNTHSWLCGKLTWGYTEFELIHNDTWIIRILCDIECELEIVFKHICISKV